MPTFEITSPDGRKFQVTAPEGASQDEVLKYAQDNMPVAKSAGYALNDVPRQIGLTARYAMEGPAQAAQLFTEPVAGLMRMGGIKTKPLGEVASSFADYIGLPKPQGANERVVADATRLVAGSGGVAGAAGLAKNLPGIAGGVANFLSANPAQQLTSAAGAGLAGGASREAGGNELQQGVSALIGGVVGGKALDIVKGAINVTKGILWRGLSTQDIDVKLSNVLRQSGVDYSQVPERIKQSLRSELQSSLQADKELDPVAVSRLLDFRAAGVTPTRGMVSQNPVQITKEQNLAKMGANSSDTGLQGLAQVQNQNNAKLISNLNDLGANRGDSLRAGEAVTGAISGNRDSLRSAETALWNEAKQSPGYTRPISASVLSDINQALGSEGMMPFMNPQISKYMEAFQNGQPFTPQAYRNLQSMLSRETMRGGNEGAAAGLAARILREADLRPAGFVSNGTPVTQSMGNAIHAADTVANESIDAVNRARAATARAYAYEDSSPLVRSVLSDARTSDPARIAQSYIIGGTANEAEDLIRNIGPQNISPIKDALLAHLKEKALNGAADEVGKFSQSAFNKAINALGERKMALLFSPEEIQALRTNGRVAALMQSQPVGSAVNNSNSGALVLGRGLDFLRNIPLVGPNVSPAIDNLKISIGTKAAKNVVPGLLAEQPKAPIGQSLIVPGLAFSGGLLSAP